MTREQLTTINEVLKYNEDNGLYAIDRQFKRIYFTYDGGIYNNQIGDIKSQYYLDRLVTDGHKIKDLNIVSDVTVMDFIKEA